MTRASSPSEWAAIIVNFNGSVFLDPCLRALTRLDRPPGRIVVVDNAAGDDSLTELAAWPGVELEPSPRNLGYAGGANLGASRTDEPIIVVLNPDVELDAEFGGELCSAFELNDRLGAAGAKLRFPASNRIQHAGGRLNWPMLTTAHIAEGDEDQGQADAPAGVDYVTGAAIALRRAAFDSVGGFDRAFYPAYFEDVDLCYRLRSAGWDVRYVPALSGVHHEGGSTGRSAEYFHLWHRNRIRFAMKHLTSRQWWQDFVPAEMERLRGEISAIDDEQWTITSGATSWELLALAGGMTNAQHISALDPRPLLEAICEIEPIVAPMDIELERLDWRASTSDRFKHRLASWRGWRFIDRFFWRQRRFNDSIVRALHAQDRVNRELTAQILLTLILLGVERSRRLSRAIRSPMSDHGSIAIIIRRRAGQR